MSDGKKKKTIIEDGTEFDGSIRSDCDIQLSGTLKGELAAPALTVTDTGAMHGCAKVSELVSEGEVSGEIDAQSVMLSGKVSDQTVIRADTLEVKLTKPEEGIQVTFGNCELQVGDKQSRASRSVKAREKEEEEPTPDPVSEPVL